MGHLSNCRYACGLRRNPERPARRKTVFYTLFLFKIEEGGGGDLIHAFLNCIVDYIDTDRRRGGERKRRGRNLPTF